MDRSVVYVACAIVFAVLLIVKLRSMRTRWGSPRLWVLCAAIFFTAVTWTLSAPANHYVVAGATGISNIAMPLITTSHVASAAAYLALALLWRYSARTAWLRLRWILSACGLAIVAMIVLFSVSSVPEEHTYDFAIHYARQPTIAAFVMIWWVWVFSGHAMLAYWCFTWARHPDYADLPWLRWSLRLYGALGVDVAAFSLMGIASVSARWVGSGVMDPIYKAVPPVHALISAVLLVVALTASAWGRWLPAAAEWTTRWRTVLLLHSLHRALRHVDPTVVFVVRGRRLDPYHRTRRMMIELSDWRWLLAPLFDQAVGEAARRLGREANLNTDDLATTVEAAQLKAAAHARRQGGHPTNGDEAEPSEPHNESARDGAIDDEVMWWVRVARAFRKSSIVSAALDEQRIEGAPSGSPSKA